MQEPGKIGTQRDLVVIQRNPHAGTARKHQQLLSLVRELRKLGLAPRMFSSRDHLDRWLQDPSRRTRLRCIVGAGGDGTLQDLVTRHPQAVLAQLPIGTENVFARHLGVPSDGRAVARMIAAGWTRRIDLGRWKDHPFVLMASVGFDAEIIHAAHSARTGHTSRWRYLWPIAVALWNRPGPELRVTIDDAPARPAYMAVIVNVPRYALGLNMASEAKDDDGLLEVRLFKRGSAWRMWWYFLHLCLGSHEQLPDVESLQGVRVLVESSSPQSVQIDGDPAGLTPVTLSIMPGSMTVVVP